MLTFVSITLDNFVKLNPGYQTQTNSKLQEHIVQKFTTASMKCHHYFTSPIHVLGTYDNELFCRLQLHKNTLKNIPQISPMSWVNLLFEAAEFTQVDRQ